VIWHGWHWTGGRWRLVCSAEGRPECHRELIRLFPRIRNNLHLAMTGGQVPAWNPDLDRYAQLSGGIP